MKKTQSCLHFTPDSCILWTGEDMPFFGIAYGNYYNTEIVKLATIVQEWIEREVSLNCLYDNTCGQCAPSVQVPEGLQIVINKLCALTTDDISNVGDLHCIGSTTLSPDAAKLLNRPFTFTVTPNASGALVSYDYSEAISNLPTGYELGKLSTRVRGTMKNGSTIISDSDKSFFTSNVKSDRFPLTAEFEINVVTPSGSVKLVKVATIAGTQDQSQTGVFDVNDFSKTDNIQFTQTDVNELLSAELCSHKSELDQLKNLDIEGCEAIQYPSKDIKAIIGVVDSTLCEHEDRIADLEEPIQYRECDDLCGEHLLEITSQEAWTKITDAMCALQQRVSDLETRLTLAETKISCCNCD